MGNPSNRRFARAFWIALGATIWPLAALAANDAPNQTDAFLAYCKINNEGCIDKVAEISFAMMVTNPRDHKWCPTKEIDDVKILTPKAVQWLTAHPEANSKTTDKGIEYALAKMYPCKR